MLLDLLPQLVDALAAQRLGEHDRRLPVAGRRRARSTCRTSFAVVAASGWSSLLIAITSGISMIPAFSAWTESPEPGISTSTTVSAIESHADLALAGADRLEEDDVLAGRVEHEQRLQRRLGEPAARGRACPSSG